MVFFLVCFCSFSPHNTLRGPTPIAAVETMKQTSFLCLSGLAGSALAFVPPTNVVPSNAWTSRSTRCVRGCDAADVCHVRDQNHLLQRLLLQGRPMGARAGDVSSVVVCRVAICFAFMRRVGIVKRTHQLSCRLLRGYLKYRFYLPS